MSGTTGVPEPVVVIGAGRAGRALAAALEAAAVATALVDRSRVVEQHGMRAASRAAAIHGAAVLLVAVRDGQLDEALDALRDDGLLRADAIVLQVSGSAEPLARPRVTAAGTAYGTFHPLLPLLEPSLASARLRGAVIGVEGDERARRAAVQLAAQLGATTIDVPRSQRAAYHAAAVLASNFPVTLAALAEDLLAHLGVDESSAHRAVRALMAASVENLDGAPRALDALTGPIARHDVTTVRAHVAALRASPSSSAVYDVMSRATLALLRARGDDPAAVAALEAALTTDGLR